MNRTTLCLAAAALSMSLGATVAQADGDPELFDGMTEQAISQIVSYAGYDVVGVDLHGDVYRVEAYEPAGDRIELWLQAADGTMVPAQASDRSTRRGDVRN